MSLRNKITQEELKNHFEYRDGHLWWIKHRNSTMLGRQFGCYKDGYRFGTFKYNTYKEHRLIWLYHYGCWPKDQLDHINGVRDDNRVENLREVNNQKNHLNLGSHVDAKSKYKGVHWFKRDSKWQAQIMCKGKKFHLGYFDTEIEAAKAYDKKAKELHGEYGRLNFG